MGNKSGVLGSEEFAKIFKVFAWTLGSAFVVLIIDWLGMIEVPAQYAFAVPIANTLLYTVKEWIADNRKTFI